MEFFRFDDFQSERFSLITRQNFQSVEFENHASLRTRNKHNKILCMIKFIFLKKT
jgi:hypothetical protein